METEQRDEQSISCTRFRLVVNTTSVDDVKDGGNERDRKETTHGYK